MSRKKSVEPENEVTRVVPTLHQDIANPQVEVDTSQPVINVWEKSGVSDQEIQRLKAAIKEHKAISWKIHGQFRQVDLKLYSALD